MEQVKDALFMVFEREQDAQEAHDEQVVQGRTVRLVKVTDRSNGQVIAADGTPSNRIREIGTRFVIYSEG
jgi:hypothetical protein